MHGAVAEDVTDGAGEMVAADRFQRMADEFARRRLLHQDDRIELQLFALREVTLGKETDRHDVLLALAREVDRYSAHRTVHGSDVVVLEREAIAVFQPLHSMIRLQQVGRIQAVAVGVQYVEFAVAVEIHEFDTARTVGGVRPLVDGFLVERAFALIEERNDRFMLLADKGHDVRLAVAVDISNRDVNSAVPIIEDARNETRFFPVARLILQVEDLAGLAPAEGGDHEIELSIAAEIGGLHVCDATDIVQKGVRLKAALAQTAQPDHAAATGIGRPKTTEVGDENVRDAVAVEVDDLGVGWVKPFGEARVVEHPP